jgi:hypothetical protein
MAALIPAPAEQAGQLYYIKELRSGYLVKQSQVEDPTKALCLLATSIVAVAIVALGNITTFLGAFGIGVCFAASISQWLLFPFLVKRLDQSNKNAADALISPGFYEFAMRDPRQLASAEQINAAFGRFLNARPAQ